jgi:hypothetical protein
MSWEGPTADDLARLEQEDRQSIVLHILPSAAYQAGDPQFWLANLTIRWEKNAAREFSAFGARALGIEVSREHLLALLPQERGRNEALQPTEPDPKRPKLTQPKAWLAKAREKHPRRKGETMAAYARLLHASMQTADVTEVWPVETLQRRLYDK